VGIHLLGEQISVDAGMHGHEGLAKAGRERGLWLLDANLGPSDLGRVPGDEVVGRLGGREPGDRRKDTESVARQENDVLRMAALGVGGAVVDELNRVRTAGVLGLARVVEIGHTVGIKDDVFQHRAVLPGGGEDGRFILFGQVDQLGIAAALEIEDAVGTPAVLVIADEGPFRVGRQGGLPGSGESEEDGRVVAVGVGGAVHGQDALLGKDEVHHREDRFFDLTCVTGPADDDFFPSIVHDDEAVGVEAIGFGVRFEVRCVKYREFGCVLLQLCIVGSNEHVAGEGVVPGVVVDHTDGQRFTEIGTAVQILNEQGGLLTEEVNHFCSHALEGGFVGGDVDIAPVDVAGNAGFVHDVLVVGRTTGALTGFGHQGAVGAEHAFTALHRHGDEVGGFEVPMDITGGVQSMVGEVAGLPAEVAAHAGRFRRPSLSLLARPRLLGTAFALPCDGVSSVVLLAGAMGRCGAETLFIALQRRSTSRRHRNDRRSWTGGQPKGPRLPMTMMCCGPRRLAGLAG